MLILTRAKGQSVEIVTATGERIRVTLSSIRGETVRIGFDAPRSMHIYRTELEIDEPQK